jgi:hypothetical protein
MRALEDKKAERPDLEGCRRCASGPKKSSGLFDDAVACRAAATSFNKPRSTMKRSQSLYPGSPEADIARERVAEMDVLSIEKRTYKRIDRNARKDSDRDWHGYRRQPGPDGAADGSRCH